MSNQDGHETIPPFEYIDGGMVINMHCTESSSDWLKAGRLVDSDKAELERMQKSKMIRRK